jgi:two-component system NtrC family response regulator
VIAATNRDLSKAVKEGGFREDLFYRVAVVVLKLPGLREREGDAVLLAQAFLKKFSRESSKEKLRFDPKAVQALRQYAWPGNVRELENRVRRAVIMSEGSRVTAADLEIAEAVEAVVPRTLKEAREAVERELVQQSLRRHGGKISRAAEELGISRPTFYELLAKLGMNRPADESE